MSDAKCGPPPGGETMEQLQAKLQGLERMRVAGLLREQQYQETRARLQEQLDALGPAPAQRFYGTSAPAWQPRQPVAETAAPPQTAYPAPAPAVAPQAPYSPPPPAYGPPPGYAPPPPPPAWQAQPSGGRRTTLIATAVGACLVLAAVAGTAVVGRTTKAPAIAATTPAATPTIAPTPTPTPDAAATLASLRNAQPAAGAPLVTVEQATQLVKAFWTVREQGLSQRNPDTIHAIEDGAAGEYDAIGCTFGCPPPSPRPLKDQQVMVPLQTSYPAAFMAQVLTTDYHTPDPMVEIIVFTRRSASAPWFLSFDTYYTGLSALHEFPAGNGGFAQGAPPPDASLLSQLAAYWQYWKNNGVAPPSTHFESGAFTTEQGLDIYKTWVDKRAASVSEHVTYSSSAQDGLWSFGVTMTSGQVYADAVLTCGTVRYHDVDTPLAPARTIVQDTSLDPYGDLLQPGEYSSVTVTGLHESCVLKAAGPSLAVEGLAGSQTRVVGVPFSGSGVSA